MKKYINSYEDEFNEKLEEIKDHDFILYSVVNNKIKLECIEDNDLKIVLDSNIQSSIIYSNEVVGIDDVIEIEAIELIEWYE